MMWQLDFLSCILLQVLKVNQVVVDQQAQFKELAVQEQALWGVQVLSHQHLLQQVLIHLDQAALKTVQTLMGREEIL